jgi:hypothetical protein
MGSKDFTTGEQLALFLLDQVFYKSETFPGIILFNGFTDSTTDE